MNKTNGNHAELFTTCEIAKVCAALSKDNNKAPARALQEKLKRAMDKRMLGMVPCGCRVPCRVPDAWIANLIIEVPELITLLSLPPQGPTIPHIT